MAHTYFKFLLFGLALSLNACSKESDKQSDKQDSRSVVVSSSALPPALNKNLRGEQLYTSQAPVMPELAKSGIWPVGVRTIDAVNPNQLNSATFLTKKDRKLTFEVWYPTITDSLAVYTTYSNETRSGQKFELQGSSKRDAPVAEADEAFPLVVLSHGYTGYRTIMFYLAEHLASHGYVVVAIDHTDSTNADVDLVNKPFSGFASTLLNRARDQQFVLESFSESQTPFSQYIDTQRSSVIGYSMGGYGAINTIGGCYSFNQEGMQQFGIPKIMIPKLLTVFNTCSAGRDEVDSRWKAMIAFSPWGGEQNVHSAESLANISIPTLYVVGEYDDISGYENGVKKLYEQTGLASSADSFLLLYENARHNIAAHPAPKVAFDTELDLGHYFEPAWDSETLNRINEHMSLAFLDCYIKDKASACDYLPTRESITQFKQADGSMTDPWPGFQARWGTGVKFYRKK